MSIVPSTKTAELRPKDDKVNKPGENISRLLEKTFRHYDKKIRPYYGVRTLDVGLNMLFLSFGELSETNMEFTVDMYLGQFWTEPRLAFGLNRTIILSGPASEKLWVPDTFFCNSIDTKIHTLIFSNKKVWIDLMNGTVMLSARLTTRNSCKVDLRDYPMDEQTCHLPIESFSYEDKDLKYTWRAPFGVGTDIFIYDTEMAQFEIVSAKRFLKHPVYHSDMFSGLTATVRFRRRSLYYIFQMYIPCICVVIVSWIAFWIDHKEGSERVGLGISALLTISYMRGSMNAGMPRVSYLKSIDYFLLTSFVFVFMSLIEYVLVIKEFRKGKRKGKPEVPEILPGTQIENEENEPMIVTVTSGNKTFRFHDPVDDYDVMSNTEAEPKLNNQQNCVKYNSQKSSVQFSNHNRTPGRRRPSRRDFQRKSSVARFITKTAKTVRPEKGVHTLDKYSRVVFPISYILFLIIYFSVQYQLGSS
ncbi:gamma-aminobutyric acid receptor subunit beta-3-like [Actinia tenebrosa]|uniref:Gamma-aminobutyric acid receptor subunit beta-3-like n=1 Tax=Actinia tenebrosa TaxID=6105 RepID=A0A6P8IBY0_ACTTE|nr:gamma-aminobutyric acid receptor subunit beta-3-like [Actinia tenebrosa]